MGGLGSGRTGTFGRTTVGSVVSLDVNRMQREGCLRAGWVGGWQWSRSDDATERIGLHVESDRVVLRYRVSSRAPSLAGPSELCPSSLRYHAFSPGGSLPGLWVRRGTKPLPQKATFRATTPSASDRPLRRALQPRALARVAAERDAS